MDDGSGTAANVAVACIEPAGRGELYAQMFMSIDYEPVAVSNCQVGSTPASLK